MIRLFMSETGNEKTNDGTYGVVTFHSTTHAIRSEKACKKAGLKVSLIPVPRHISSDCGVCLRFSAHDRECIIALLESNRIEISRIVML